MCVSHPCQHKHCHIHSYISFIGTVSLEMVLVFFSGANDIPPMGYPYDPVINFNPISPYPTSSTCALQVTSL